MRIDVRRADPPMAPAIRWEIRSIDVSSDISLALNETRMHLRSAPRPTRIELVFHPQATVSLRAVPDLRGIFKALEQHQVVLIGVPGRLRSLLEGITAQFTPQQVEFLPAAPSEEAPLGR